MLWNYGSYSSTSRRVRVREEQSKQQRNPGSNSLRPSSLCNVFILQGGVKVREVYAGRSATNSTFRSLEEGQYNI